MPFTRVATLFKMEAPAHAARGRGPPEEEVEDFTSINDSDIIFRGRKR